MTSNKYDLSRYIGANLKRKIRKECGFGCILCGKALYHFHHIDPGYKFKEIKEHEVDKIGLVCAGCHDPETRGYWSPEDFQKARKSPYCIKHRESIFKLFGINPEKELIIKLGKTSYVNTPNIILIDGKEILSIRKPEEPDSPPEIHAIFYDRDGKRIASIQNNEWIGSADAFDIQTNGGSIKVNSRKHKIDLEIKRIDYNIIEIQRMDLRYKNCKIIGDTDIGFKVRTVQSELIWGIGNSIFQNAEYGIKVEGEVIHFGANKPIKLPNGSYDVMKMPITTRGGRAIINEVDRSLSLGSIQFKNDDLCYCGSNLTFKNCCKIREAILGNFKKDVRIFELYSLAKSTANVDIVFKNIFALNNHKIGIFYNYKSKNPIIELHINSAFEKITIDHLASALCTISILDKFYILYDELSNNYPNEKDLLLSTQNKIALIFKCRKLHYMKFSIENAHNTEIENVTKNILNNLQDESCDLVNSLDIIFLESIIENLSHKKQAEINLILKSSELKKLFYYPKFKDIFKLTIDQSELKSLKKYQTATYMCLCILNNYYSNKFHLMLNKLNKCLI